MKKNIVLSLIVILFFQNSLQDIFPIVQYVDEIIALICIIFFIMRSIVNKMILKNDLFPLFLAFILLIIGFLGNYLGNDSPSIFYQFVDVIGIFKFYFIILYLGKSNNFFTNKLDVDYVLNILKLILRIYLAVLIYFSFNNIFRDIGMNYGERYGLRAFSFVYGTPGLIINQMSYNLVVFEIINLRSKKPRKIIPIENLLSLFIILTTLRFRGFFLVGLYALLIFYNRKDKKKAKKKKNISSLFLFTSGILALIIGKNQFSMYFLEGDTPRQRFVIGAIKLAKEHWPLGSGFGTFGSSVAADQYSKIYYKLGFNRYYGMSENQKFYLNDNYFPMILGQLGFIGAILFLFFLFVVLKRFINKYKKSRYQSLSIFITIDILFSSIQSSYLAHYSVVALLFIFMILALNGEDLNDF